MTGLMAETTVAMEHRATRAATVLSPIRLELLRLGLLLLPQQQYVPGYSS